MKGVQPTGNMDTFWSITKYNLEKKRDMIMIFNYYQLHTNNTRLLLFFNVNK